MVCTNQKVIIKVISTLCNNKQIHCKFSQLLWQITQVIFSLFSIFFSDLHPVFLFGVDGQKVRRGLYIIGQFRLRQLCPEWLESLCRFLHHQSKTFNGLQVQHHPCDAKIINCTATCPWCRVTERMRSYCTSTYKRVVLKHNANRRSIRKWRKSITDYLKASPQIVGEGKQFICLCCAHFEDKGVY